MSHAADKLAAQLSERFGETVHVGTAYHETTLEILAASDLLNICEALSSEAEFSFEEMIDLCGVDYLDFGRAEWETHSATDTGFSRGVKPKTDSADAGNREKRFAVAYHLLSLKNNQRLRLKVFLDEDDLIVDSVVGIWPVANWFEREAFDLYGIMFRGHPDLRRILTDYGFIGHPFRKDFPLIGNVEMRYDPDKQRVVYEPVSIDPRTLVPKVVREDWTGKTAGGRGE